MTGLEDSGGALGCRRFLLPIAGPVVITLAYLVAEAVRGEEHFAPGEGAGAAQRVLWRFALYGAALLTFVILGTLTRRGAAAKTTFAIVSIMASLVLMFLAFFVQMAP